MKILKPIAIGFFLLAGTIIILSITFTWHELGHVLAMDFTAIATANSLPKCSGMITVPDNKLLLAATPNCILTNGLKSALQQPLWDLITLAAGHVMEFILGSILLYLGLPWVINKQTEIKDKIGSISSFLAGVFLAQATIGSSIEIITGEGDFHEIQVILAKTPSPHILINILPFFMLALAIFIVYRINKLLST